MSVKRIALRAALVSVGAGAACLLAVVGGGAAGAAGSSVSTTPASFTPWLLRSTPQQEVRQLAQCGGSMYAVGKVSAIGQGTSSYTRGNGFSFNASTGAMTSWDPRANGEINAIAFSPDCSTAYLGGTFSSVGGGAAKDIAAVSTSTGALITGFAHSANNAVDTLQYTHGVVLAGGVFTTIDGAAVARLASLDPSTGAPTSYAALPISGQYSSEPSKVYNSQISHDGSRMLIEGIFTSVGGQARKQVAMLDLGASSVTVDAWNSAEFNTACAVWDPFYVRAGAWSPDDGTVYFATTGYSPGATGRSSTGPGALCDAASAFPSTSGPVTHSWVNYSGCDSMEAIVADASNVYIAGHERWANNAQGCDAAGPGAVARPGIGDIDPGSGLATSWNPTRGRGYGADDLLLTGAGLWVASDNFKDGSVQTCGGKTNHGGICFLPN